MFLNIIYGFLRTIYEYFHKIILHQPIVVSKMTVYYLRKKFKSCIKTFDGKTYLYYSFEMITILLLEIAHFNGFKLHKS